MNVEKARRYAARKTPDTVSRLFDPLTHTENDLNVWLGQFKYQMRIKHGANSRGVQAWEYDYYGPERKVMITLQAKLHKKV